MAENSITIRLNDQERSIIDELKKFYGFSDQFGEDSKTIKAALNFALNASRLFYGESLPQLFAGVKAYKDYPADFKLKTIAKVVKE